jgi:hypothetical protein
MAGYIHNDVNEIMEDASNADSSNKNIPSTKGWSEDQLKSLNLMLQYAWNRGYKSAYQDIQE